MICASAQLVERGDGIRFELELNGATVPGFVVRHDDVPRAFVNRCAHVAMELDWNAGKFFDRERTWLICSTHAAHYDPVGGACRGGPCRGRGLEPLPVIERDGFIFLQESEHG